MIIGIGNEAGIFLYAALTGVIVVMVYQILRCLRRLIRHSMLAVGIEDLLFWIAASIYIFRKMYDTTYGSIRWFFVLGAVAGAGAGELTRRLFGKILIKGKKSLEKYRKTR
nr:spore cortex biosynthesis protein YabQ [uncultured Mediterraneibacter sp.]